MFVKFGFCDILNNQGLAKTYFLISLSSLITLDILIKKTSSNNNCFFQPIIIHNVVKLLGFYLTLTAFLLKLYIKGTEVSC